MCHYTFVSIPIYFPYLSLAKNGKSVEASIMYSKRLTVKNSGKSSLLSKLIDVAKLDCFSSYSSYSNSLISSSIYFSNSSISGLLSSTYCWSDYPLRTLCNSSVKWVLNSMKNLFTSFTSTGLADTNISFTSEVCKIKSWGGLKSAFFALGF